MQVTPASTRSATRTPGRPPCRASIAAHAGRRAAFTAATTLQAVFSPPEAIPASVRHAVGTDATGPNMHQQPAAGQRPRQAPGQPGPVCQLAQQDQARVHHDPRPALT